MPDSKSAKISGGLIFAGGGEGFSSALRSKVVRPGERTAQYIDYVLTRITVLGALYLAVICLLPEWLISYAALPFYFGGTSLLIVVNVTMDTVAQIHGHLQAHQYEGLIRKARLKGRKR